MRNPLGWALKTFIWDPAHMGYSMGTQYQRCKANRRYYEGIKVGIIIGKRIAEQEQKENENNA